MRLRDAPIRLLPRTMMIDAVIQVIQGATGTTLHRTSVVATTLAVANQELTGGWLIRMLARCTHPSALVTVTDLL